jgi:hypothetical protein
VATTLETPFTHVRGTDLVLTGIVHYLGLPKTAANGGSIANDTIYFAIADRLNENEQTRLIAYETPAAEITVLPGIGSYTVIVPRDSTKFGRLPDNEYWLQVDLLDAVTGFRSCIAKGPLRLTSSPYGT